MVKHKIPTQKPKNQIGKHCKSLFDKERRKEILYLENKLAEAKTKALLCPDDTDLLREVFSIEFELIMKIAQYRKGYVVSHPFM